MSIDPREVCPRCFGPKPRLDDTCSVCAQDAEALLETSASTESTVPGGKAKHAIVTPTCRVNRGVREAAEEACRRLVDEYMECVELNPPETQFHFVLTVQRPTGANPQEKASAHEHRCTIGDAEHSMCVCACGATAVNSMGEMPGWTT